MGVLGRYGASALKYWANILNSAYQGQSTADVWTAIRNQQAAYGLPTPQTTAPDVSVLRGFANRVVNGARALGAAADTDTILPGMMATAPYTLQDQAGIAATPTYYVRYQGTTQAADGTVSTRWVTSVMTAADMPSTVGELRAAIDLHHSELVAQAAQQTGDESGGISLGTASLEITVA